MLPTESNLYVGNVKIEWVMDMCMQICFHVQERVVISSYSNRHLFAAELNFLNFVISIYSNRYLFAAELNFLNFQFNILSDTSPLFASGFLKNLV